MADFYGKFRREGELTLTLHFPRDDSSYQPIDSICSTTITFSKSHDQDIMYIGAIYGSEGDRREEVKQLTKELHGLRPKSLMFFVLQTIANHLNITKILGIDDAYLPLNKLIYKLQYKKNLLPKTNYAQFWLENEAEESTEPGFWELPLNIKRCIEDHPSHKRSMYRKRFEMMLIIENKIKTILEAQ